MGILIAIMHVIIAFTILKLHIHIQFAILTYYIRVIQVHTWQLEKFPIYFDLDFERVNRFEMGT